MEICELCVIEESSGFTCRQVQLSAANVDFILVEGGKHGGSVVCSIS